MSLCVRTVVRPSIVRRVPSDCLSLPDHWRKGRVGWWVGVEGSARLVRGRTVPTGPRGQHASTKGEGADLESRPGSRKDTSFTFTFSPVQPSSFLYPLPVYAVPFLQYSLHLLRPLLSQCTGTTGVAGVRSSPAQRWVPRPACMHAYMHPFILSILPKRRRVPRLNRRDPPSPRLNARP